MRLTDEQIDKAVEWWKEKLRHPKFSMYAPNSKEDAWAIAHYKNREARAYSKVEDISEARIQTFAEILRRHLQESRESLAYFMFDYQPDAFFAEVIELSPIPITQFSWKATIKFMNDGNVVAKCGHGAPFINI